MSVLQLWTIEQSVLGCGKKTRSNASLEQLIAWAKEENSQETVPSLVWRTELALLYSEAPPGYLDTAVPLLGKALGIRSKDISVPWNLDFGVVHSGKSEHASRQRVDHSRSYKITDIEFGLIWTWDPAKRLTRGLMYGCMRDRSGTGRLLQVLKGLQRNNHMRTNPLILGIVHLDSKYHANREWVEMRNQQMLTVELATGRHEYMGFGREVDIRQLDLTDLSCKTCGMATGISRTVLLLQLTLKLADFIVEESKTVTGSRFLEDTGLSSNLKASEAYVFNLIRHWKLQTTSLLYNTQSMQWRAGILVQTVFTLTTQRDQEVSIEIARDSKILAQQATRDSTSMKSIAAVTMCFLPGTFVAVSYDM